MPKLWIAKGGGYRPCENEIPIDWVAHCNTVVAVSARDRVIECPRVFVHELKSPCFTAVSSFVDARRFAVAYAEDVCGVCVEGFDVAEIEFLGAGHRHYIPGFTAVNGTNHCSLGAACP